MTSGQKLVKGEGKKSAHSLFIYWRLGFCDCEIALIVEELLYAMVPRDLAGMPDMI